MEVLTKLIVLATAVIGLYKAATFGRERPSGAVGSGSFAPLLQMGGMLLFVLAVPAFLWAFSWIMSNMPGVRDNNVESHDVVPAIADLPKDANDRDVLLITAKGLQSLAHKRLL